jgi:AraC-like DNA-binding protein
VETLQQLDAENAEEIVNGSETFESKEDVAAFSIQANIGMLLEQQCKAKQLYLQHDLTLKQLSVVIGTNRTYLSAYFAQQGITYNTYINSLRIEHFISLYRKSAESSLSVNATKLAQQSGFGSYSTFSVAFKRYTGSTVSAWMRQEACSHDIA